MNFPDKVIFRIIDAKTKKTVKNIAVLLVLYAHKKNNYSIEAKISDINGNSIFTKQDCLRGIESSKSFYLMDYASNLEECLPCVSIKIIDKSTIDFVVKDRKKNREIYKDYWDCSEEFLGALELTDNYKYMNKTYDFFEFNLWQNDIIEIQIEKIIGVRPQL